MGDRKAKEASMPPNARVATSSTGPGTQSLPVLLDALGWPPSTLARRLGVSLNTAQSWAKGHRNPPSDVLAWLSQIAVAMEACPSVPPGWQGLSKGRRKGPADDA